MKAPNPHDRVFKEIFGQPANAASELRSMLPPAVLARLDLNRLKRVDSGFIGTDLAERDADLLFTVPLEGREAFIYVLAEHQSSDDPLMAFRMLRYVVAIQDRYLRTHQRARHLPVVIPLVVHQSPDSSGRRRWASPVQVADLYDIDAALRDWLRPYLPRMEFLLDDLPGSSLVELARRPLTEETWALFAFLQTAPGNPTLDVDLDAWLPLLRRANTATVTLLLRYSGIVGNTEPERVTDFAAHISSTVQEATVTTAEMLRAEGAAAILLDLIAAKFGAVTSESATRINGATPDDLLTWSRRILTADTIDDLWG